MAPPQPPAPESPLQGQPGDLPAITVEGHALFEFSMKMNRALKRLEKRFDARDVSPVPMLRQAWKQASRKPR